MPKADGSNNLRRKVAVEAARLMLEHGIEDYLAAKKKAAQRLGLREHSTLPTNQEIETALLENQRLFFGREIQERLHVMRLAGLAAMDLFTPYRPRLVGSVLSGAITLNSTVELHVFSDNPDSIAMLLLDNTIDYQMTERRVRLSADRYAAVPAYYFELNYINIEVLVFNLNGERQSPLCPVNGKPMQRIASDALQRLLEEQNSERVIDGFFS